jgi:hypothetical protein
MLALFAEFDNDIRTIRCSTGMNERIKGGIYPWQPPVGYLCGNFKKQGLKKTEPDKPHPKTFSIIQTALREMSNGLHNKIGLVRRLKILGLDLVRGKPTTPQFVDSMLEEKRLKFYAGWLFEPNSKEYIKGKHEKMITDLEVQMILNVLKGKKNSTAHTRLNPLFPLRGWMLCDMCNNKLTGSVSRGGSGLTHAYYHCFNDKCSVVGKSVSKKEVEQAFSKYLSTITPKNEWLEIFKASIVDYWEEKGKKYIDEINAYTTKIKNLEQKKKQIFLMREDGSYTKEEFLERKNSIEAEIMAVTISLNESNLEKFDIDNVLFEATEFLKDLGIQWLCLPDQLKLKFQKLIFPNGFSYSKELGIRTEKIGYIYRVH